MQWKVKKNAIFDQSNHHSNCNHTKEKRLTKATPFRTVIFTKIEHTPRDTLTRNFTSKNPPIKYPFQNLISTHQ